MARGAIHVNVIFIDPNAQALEKEVAPTTTLRTPARQLLQIGLKKEQPYQHFPLHAFPADASR